MSPALLWMIAALVAVGVEIFTVDLTFGLIFGAMMVVLGLVLVWYLRTDFGLAMRAVGDNPAMITAQGVDRRRRHPARPSLE